MAQRVVRSRLWFKTSTANKPLLQYGASGTGSLFKLSLNSSGAAVLDLGSATITSSTTGLADGNWHHIAASFPSAANSGAAKLYVDGTGTMDRAPPRLIPAVQQT